MFSHISSPVIQSISISEISNFRKQWQTQQEGKEARKDRREEGREEGRKKRGRKEGMWCHYQWCAGNYHFKDLCFFIMKE